jgi:drug/metabolite transporter (DMT)-like permease
MKIVALTLLALVAFAGNSVLCRLALHDNQIDAASFTMVRLLAGALVLWALFFMKRQRLLVFPLLFGRQPLTAWLAPLVLFLYAAFFSFAYVLLNTGVGALFLFGAVQITMISVAIYNGKRLLLQEWCGVILAFGGLVYLIYPSFYPNSTVSDISLWGAGMMLLAGVAWGLYSLYGGQSSDPLKDTANNFLKTIPFVLILLIVFLFEAPKLSANGLLLALASGMITSGLGYAIWYSALKGLTSIQAAVVQLFVPVLAAVGGLIFAGEIITWHIAVSGLMVMAGILWVTFTAYRQSDS